MNFQYFYQEMPTADIEIEDMGNCVLRAYNDNADEWNLRIKTELGWSEVEQFGSLTADSDYMGFYFNYSYSKFEYAEKRLFKVIDDFINNPKKSITQVEEISSEEFEERLKNIKKDD